ncbi:stage V sporulation protein SpoVM [Chungangia koreensis]|uniref:Stage V sporulation protein SpoVM n=1 Tax=Chungangia koreensis TaxID=752657 RepID=A0ABV8X3P3_9LACT
MRVYTFRLPKMVSSFARKCISVFQKEEGPKGRKEKMPG